MNSIGVNDGDTLAVTNNSTFTATDGTVTLGSDTGTVLSGVQPDGAINVQSGSTLVIGSTFVNEGNVRIALPKTFSSSGSATFQISGRVTLTGSGTVDLGTSLANETSGDIENLTSGNGLTNANNTITGNGLIALTNFDNQAGGTVEVSGAQGFLDVYATGTWTNEGQMIAEPNDTLDLGANAVAATLTNTGSVVVDQSGDLAISGTFTLAGSGSLNFAGESGKISTNGSTPATFINESTIDSEELNVQISGSALTFENIDGTVNVESGAQLSVYTGNNAIIDNGGGLIEAEDGSALVSGSAVDTGGFFNVNTDTGGGGTIEAVNGGVVFFDAGVAAGGSGVDFLPGDVEIGDFSAVIVNGGSIAVPIAFSGPGAVLAINSAAEQVTGQISGFAGGDFLDLEGISFSGVQANWSENKSGTSGVLTVSNGSTSETFDINGDFSPQASNCSTTARVVRRSDCKILRRRRPPPP